MPAVPVSTTIDVSNINYRVISILLILTLHFYSFLVAAGVNAEPIVKYEGGIVNNTHFWNMMVNHIVSIVGWGTDQESGQQYWIVRNRCV